MTKVSVGCMLDRLPGPRGAKALSFFEYAPRKPLPSFATLARFRKRVPKQVACALVAPKSCWMTPRGALRPSPELDEGIAWLTRVADIIDAFAIVLATGAELTTGERDKSLLADVIKRLATTGRTIVIAPGGLWDPEDGVPFARATGSVYAFDPLEHEGPEGPIVYARVHPMGARPRLSEGHLAQIAARVLEAGGEQAYVSIDSEQSFRDMKRLARLIQDTVALGALAGDAEEDEDMSDVEDEELEAGASDEDATDEQAGDDEDEDVEEDEELDDEDEDLEDEDEDEDEEDDEDEDEDEEDEDEDEEDEDEDEEDEEDEDE